MRTTRSIPNLLLIISLLFSLFTGFSGTAAAAEEISRLVLSKNELTMNVGEAQSLTATAIYVSGKTENVTIMTDWTSGSPNIASVYAGTITAKAEGSAVITATYMGKTEIIHVQVNKKVKSLSKDKQSIQIRKGAKEQVQLTATYTDGTTETVTAKAEWSVEDENIATVENGLITGYGSGETSVTARYGNQVVTIPVSVEIVRRLDPNKSTVSLLLNGTEKMQLIALFPDGSTEDVAEKAEWSSSNEAVADAFKGVITAYGAGQATITAKYGTKTVTINVDVDKTSKLELDKENLFMRVGTSEQLKLTATYMDGSTVDITDKAEWSSSSEAVASVNKGKISAYSSGEAKITAKYGEKSVSILVDVEIPRRLDITPDYLAMRSGETKELTLTATYANGTKENITDKAQWSSNNEDSLFVLKGKVTAYKPGEASVMATYGGKSTSLIIDVDVPVKITASSESIHLQPGETRQINAKALFGDGNEEDITDKAEWSSGSTSTAEVRKGLVTGVGTGATTITVKYGKRSITIPVSVGIVKSLSADQSKLVMKSGNSTKVKVTATYSDETEKEVTSLATWTSSDSKVAEVNAGSITAKGPGRATISASFQNQTVNISVEVDQAQTLSVNPVNLILEVNESQQLTLKATDLNGNEEDVTRIAEWSSSSTKVATVNFGLVSGLSSGKTTVTAKYGGKTVTIPVEVGMIQKLESNVRILSLKSGEQVNITLTAYLSDGRASNVTSLAEWKSSSYKIVDVANGVAKGIGYGKATLTAKYGGKSISIPVDVDTLKYLKTDYVKIEMKVGETKQVKAIATYMDGSDQDVTKPALWTTSKLLVADVKDGVIRAIGKGKATITVKFAGKSTKVEVTVK